MTASIGSSRRADGYGATPANWKGWVASIAFLGLVFVVPFVLWHRSKTREVPLAAGQLAFGR